MIAVAGLKKVVDVLGQKLADFVDEQSEADAADQAGPELRVCCRPTPS